MFLSWLTILLLIRGVCSDGQENSTVPLANVAVITFNVNGRTPPKRIDSLFVTASDTDVYVIGLQEMVVTVDALIGGNAEKEKRWISTILASIPEKMGQYRIIANVRLAGIMMVVLRKENLPLPISNITATSVATGVEILGRKVGNKGGAGVSLLIDNTRIAFINSHLAAGDEKSGERNEDYKEISTTSFSNGLSVFDHDVVIWMGDLNYRLNTVANGISNSDVRRLASLADFETLLKYDQLKEQQLKEDAFVGFREGNISFPPTYKYDIGTNIWDTSEKARNPAWCDRILWWIGDDSSTINLNSYTSIPSITLSDHKPVRAELSIEMRAVKPRYLDNSKPVNVASATGIAIGIAVLIVVIIVVVIVLAVYGCARKRRAIRDRDDLPATQRMSHLVQNESQSGL